MRAPQVIFGGTLVRLGVVICTKIYQVGNRVFLTPTLKNKLTETADSFYRTDQMFALIVALVQKSVT
jgi:hypothetical protein